MRLVRRNFIMSNNIGKKPVAIKEGVQMQIEDGMVKVTGPKGSLETKLLSGISLELVNNQAMVKKTDAGESTDKFVGLMRALLSNMVTGVSIGFEKKLELTGVGYRAKIEGQDLVLNVGYANAVRISPPQGVTIQVAEGVITVLGSDKALIGDLASKIRKVRIPDPYKAKGIKYQGEKIRRKVGKAAKAVGAK